MAVIATTLDHGNHAGSVSSQATNSISPAANALIIVSVVNDTTGGGGASPATIPTITGNGITYTQIATKNLEADHAYRLTLFQGSAAAPSAGAITIDFAGNNQGGISWTVDQLTQVDLTAPVVQSANNTTGSGTSLAVTLAAFTNATNATYGAIACDATITIVKGSNFTELANQGVNTAIESQWANNNQTTVNWTFGSNSAIAIAVEIKAALAGGEFLFNLI